MRETLPAPPRARAGAAAMAIECVKDMFTSPVKHSSHCMFTAPVLALSALTSAIILRLGCAVAVACD